MSKMLKMRKSLVLAGMAIFAAPATARGPLPPDPACVAQVQTDCTTHWQGYGYHTYQDCVDDQTCKVCNVYLCGGVWYMATGKADPGKAD